MYINLSFHRLFSILTPQFSIFILFFYHSTQVHFALTSSLTNSRTAQAMGRVENILLSYITADLKIRQPPNFNPTYAPDIRSYSNADFYLASQETTVGTTETTDVSDDLPESSTELPVEITTQPNEFTNGTSSTSTTVGPGVIDPGEEEDIYWYERPEGYVTLSVIGTLTLIGVGSAVVFICKNKLAIQTAQKATTNTP